MTAPTDAGLLPCPFCGAAAHFEIDDDRWEWIECESCCMQGNRGVSLMEDCKPNLAEAWNRRAPQAVAGGEPVGSLSIQHFRGSRSMENVDLDYFGKLDPGTYQVYTAPPQQAAPEPLTDEQCDAIYEALDVFGRDVCQYDYGLPHQIDDTPAKQLARNHIRSAAHSITKGGEHGAE